VLRCGLVSGGGSLLTTRSHASCNHALCNTCCDLVMSLPVSHHRDVDACSTGPSCGHHHQLEYKGSAATFESTGDTSVIPLFPTFPATHQTHSLCILYILIHEVDIRMRMHTRMYISCAQLTNMYLLYTQLVHNNPPNQSDYLKEGQLQFGGHLPLTSLAATQYTVA